MADTSRTDRARAAVTPLRWGPRSWWLVACLATLAPAFPAVAQEPGLRMSEAVAAALASNLTLLVQQQQVVNDRGVYQAARGAFAANLQLGVGGTRAKTPLTASEEAQAGVSTDLQRTLTYGASLTSLLRTGATVGGTLSASRSTDALLQTTPLHKVSFDLSYRQPLARGRGQLVATAQEEAARHSLEASELTLRDTMATTVAAAVLAYWDYAAAAEQVVLLRRAEDEQRQLLDVLNRLVAGDVIAPGDLPQAEAQLASRAIQTIDAEQLLRQARHDLGATMGLPPEEAAALPLPALVLGDPQPGPADVAGRAAALTGRALRLRDDIRALRAQRQAVASTSLAAADQLQPQLDLVLDTGYSSLAEGSGWHTALDAYSANAGPTVSATVTLQAPMLRDQARGNLLRARAADRELEVRIADGERGVTSDIELSATTLALRASQAAKARAAVTGYRTALDNVRRRMQLGSATVVDVLLIADQLVQAELQELGFRRSWARELCTLRYLSATLLRDDGAPAATSEAELVTWPEATGTGPG